MKHLPWRLPYTVFDLPQGLLEEIFEDHDLPDTEIMRQKVVENFVYYTTIKNLQNLSLQIPLYMKSSNALYHPKECSLHFSTFSQNLLHHWQELEHDLLNLYIPIHEPTEEPPLCFDNRVPQNDAETYFKYLYRFQGSLWLRCENELYPHSLILLARHQQAIYTLDPSLLDKSYKTQNCFAFFKCWLNSFKEFRG